MLSRMNHYDPPEIDWQDPYSEWEPPQPPVHHARAGQAATWLWLTSGVTIVFFGFCLGCAALAVTIMPQDELMSQLSAEQREALGGMNIQTLMIVLFTLSMIIMVLPAIVNIFLGFAIRRGSSPARIAAIIILSLQGLLLAGMLLINSVTSLVQGDVISFLSNACITGILLALIIVTLFHLITISQPQ